MNPNKIRGHKTPREIQDERSKNLDELISHVLGDSPVSITKQSVESRTYEICGLVVYPPMDEQTKGFVGVLVYNPRTQLAQIAINTSSGTVFSLPCNQLGRTMLSAWWIDKGGYAEVEAEEIIIETFFDFDDADNNKKPRLEAFVRDYEIKPANATERFVELALSSGCTEENKLKDYNY